MLRWLALALVAAGLAIALDLAAWWDERRAWLAEWRRKWQAEVR